MTHKGLEEYILAKPGSWLDYPFGEDVAVYKVGSKETGKMFALIAEGKDPIRVSLKCDPLLAQTLREKYDSVMPGYHLNKKLWNTIVCAGELPDEEIFGFVTLSYNLVVEGLSKSEQERITAGS